MKSCAVYACRLQPVERMSQAPDLRGRARQRMDATAAVLMHVLGNVDEVREITECADYIERLRDGQVEQVFQLALDRWWIGFAGAPKANGGLPDRFDSGEAPLPRLRAQHVAQQPAEQPRVFLERQILVGSRVHLRRAGPEAIRARIVASLRRGGPIDYAQQCRRLHQRAARQAASAMSDPSLDISRQALLDHRRRLAARSLVSLFDGDPQRAGRLSLAWDDWLADWSKQRVVPETMALLLDYARERNLPAWVSALFSGERINLSEQRPALHTALRQQSDAPVLVDGADVVPAIRATQGRMRTLATQLRAGLRLGATGRPIRDVVNIGIGGSDLGPALVCEALAGPRVSRREGIDVAFVSNVDPEHLTRALTGLDPATTLFIVASKTFTTTETLRNAQAAREWLATSLGGGTALSRHFVAVTANVDAARAFGVASADVLPMW
ncbi:MAG TPA: hypothetical protein VLK83_04190, partial [Rhodanobacteraceae bacterium]|nr:hypothetical protein [Rhodanobacteraceae bacterium]